jgi:hypothetical protein
MKKEPENITLLARLRLRWSPLWNRLRGVVLFATGIAAALLALLIFSALTPKPEVLTERQVRETVFQVMASATPAPSYSAQVYQIIHPSLS